MKPEAQRIAIAEFCGWTPNCGYKNLLDSTFYGCAPGGDPRTSWERIPDYLNDLNAVHEAEKKLIYSKRMRFVRHLQYVIGSQESVVAVEHCTFATSTQRCEALLRTIGKWVE